MGMIFGEYEDWERPDFYHLRKDLIALKEAAQNMLENPSAGWCVARLPGDMEKKYPHLLPCYKCGACKMWDAIAAIETK